MKWEPPGFVETSQQYTFSFLDGSYCESSIQYPSWQMHVKLSNFYL